MSETKLKAEMNDTQLAAYEKKKARETAKRHAGTPTHWLALSCGCPHRATELKPGAVIVRALHSGCPVCGLKKTLVRLPALAAGRG